MYETARVTTSYPEVVNWGRERGHFRNKQKHNEHESKKAGQIRDKRELISTLMNFSLFLIFNIIIIIEK